MVVVVFVVVVLFFMFVDKIGIVGMSLFSLIRLLMTFVDMSKMFFSATSRDFDNFFVVVCVFVVF